MKRFLALIIARNKEFYRDRSTLMWSLGFPFVVLAGFTYGYSGKQEPLLRVRFVAPISSGTTAIHPKEQRIIEALRGVPGIEFKDSADEAAAMKKLERFETDLVLLPTSDGNGDGGALHYAVNQDSDKGKLSQQLLVDAVARSPEAERPRLEARTVAGKKIRYSDWLLPGLLAMNIMFGSMFGVGYVIVRYRKNGVLKRLRATPLSAFQFLTAQVASRMLLMLVTSSMVLIGAMILIGFHPQGSWVDAAIFLCVSSTAMISLGLVVAARISSEEVADGVLNLMTWPMIFLSGIWFSIEGASNWVLFAAKLMPLSHVVSGLRAILIDGARISDVTPQIFVLLALSALFIGIASVIFRWR